MNSFSVYFQLSLELLSLVFNKKIAKLDLRYVRLVVAVHEENGSKVGKWW
jgi:hypothetical protein